MRAIADGFRCRGTTTAAAGHREQIGLRTVRSHARREQTVRVRAVLQNGRARAVAEEHTGVAIFPIDDGGKLLRTNHQHRVVGVRIDELLADLNPVDETRASGLEIECGGAVRANLLLDETGRRGERHIGRDGGDDDEIDLLRLHASHRHRAARGCRTEVGSKLIVSRDAPLLDAGTAHDPFVGGLDNLREVGVGDDALRYIRADAGDGAGAALEIVLRARVLDFLGGAHQAASDFAAANAVLAAAISRRMAVVTWLWVATMA